MHSLLAPPVAPVGADDPADPATLRRRQRGVLRSLAITLALLALVGAVATMWGGISYERTRRDAREELGWRLHAADDSLGTLLTTGARVAGVLAHEIGGFEPEQMHLVEPMLAARAALWADTFAFDLVEPAPLASPRAAAPDRPMPPPPAELAGATVALHGGAGHVGRPYRRGEHWMLPIYASAGSHRWVVASIDLDALSAPWRRLGLPEQGVITLVGPDQRVWLRLPSAQGAIGVDVSHDQLHQRMRASGAAAGDGGIFSSPIDRVERQYAWKRLDAAGGLHLVAGTPTALIQRGWVNAFGLPAAVSLLLAVGLAFAAPLMIGRARSAEQARQQAVERLRRTEARWNFALEGSDVGVWDWDAATDRVYFSSRWKAMLGFAEHEIGDGLNEWSSRVHPEDSAHVYAALAPHLAGSTPLYASEHRLRCRDGSYKWILDRGKVVARDAQGKPLRVVGTHTDITDRRRAEQAVMAQEAAERASRAKSEFLSRMSHELRTPMNAVIGFAQLLRLDPREPPSPAQAERLAHIEHAGAHLLTMINDVLDLTRIETSHLPVSLVEVPAADAAADALALVAGMAAAHEVSLHHRIAPLSDLRLRADGTRLRQVLVNLLSNAVKYNRRGGSVDVSAERVPAAAGALPRIALHVTDTGRGLTPAQLADLFQPFNRLGAEARGVEGTGIGLVLSKRLAQLMGGDLTVSSEPGVGTRATLVLTDARALPTPAVAAPATDGADAHDDIDLPQTDFQNSRAADAFMRNASLPPAPAPAAPASAASAACAASASASGRDSAPAWTVLYLPDGEASGQLVRQALKLRPQVSLVLAPDAASVPALARQCRPRLLLVDVTQSGADAGDTDAVLAQAVAQWPAAADLAGITRVALVAGDGHGGPARGFDVSLRRPLDVAAFLGFIDQQRRLATNAMTATQGAPQTSTQVAAQIASPTAAPHEPAAA
ncbi:MAG: ATP-binding protein [Burkholderiaceae bacterium]|jgi:PAS domain S-box-containing protein|nr:ATP-binding protein [Burkholderiaceae bacterium]